MEANGVMIDTAIFHAGTSLLDGKIISAGGRVIAATATADTLEEAVKKAYEGVKCIEFQDMFYRKDIAHRFAPPPLPSSLILRKLTFLSEPSSKSPPK